MQPRNAIAVPLMTALLAACNGGLPQPAGAQAAVPVNSSPGEPFPLGLQPSAPVSSFAVAGAAIPNLAGGFQRVYFVAFVTAADAGDADGVGTTDDPLDLSKETPEDTNGDQDVFLGAFVSRASDTSGAFELRLFEITQHPRCITCHGQFCEPSSHTTSDHDEFGFDDQDGSGAQVCLGCHLPGFTGVPAEFEVGGVQFNGWSAPPLNGDPDDCAIFDFRNRDPDDLCVSISNRFAGGRRTLEEQREKLLEHLTEDPIIRWAIENGRIPGGGQVQTVPIAFDGPGDQDWVGLVRAWMNGWVDDDRLPDTSRFNCESSRSRLDLALVSRNLDGDAAGNSGSHRPSIVYVPNPAFSLVDPEAEPAGFVHVAYDSDATDLVGADGNFATDVFRTTIEVRVDALFLEALPNEGVLDLVYVPGSTARASVRTGGGEASGRSTDASISASGDRIAFVSEAADLVDLDGDLGFDDDGNGASDVFVHELSSERTILASVTSDGLASGNGASGGAVLSAGSNRGVAFDSRASDLVSGDTNAQRDVFYALLTAAPLSALGPTRRASVRTGGGQATGGDSSGASLLVLDADAADVLVAFESDKTDLASPLPPNSSRQVYLHESLGSGRTTLMNQKRLPLPFVASAGQGSLPCDSRRAALTPDGKRLLFESQADNIDAVRGFDDNGAEDVFQVDLEDFLGTGRILAERVSITRDGFTCTGTSTAVLAGAFRGPDEGGRPRYRGRTLLYRTTASNVPSDSATGAVLVYQQGPASIPD